MQHPFYCDSKEPRGPTLRPKDAAALILVRRDAGTVRVLMGARHHGHVFLPGRFVFPGGRIDLADQRLNVATDFRPEVQAKVAVGIPTARARALGLAAIRETFEEAGILVGETGGTAPRTKSESWRRFFSHGVVPRLEGLDFIARAITPPGRPRRFDARFFMVEAEGIARTLDAAEASGELLKTAWLSLAEARASDIIPITRCILDEIEARLGDGPGSGRPVPFYLLQCGKVEIRSL